LRIPCDGKQNSRAALLGKAKAFIEITSRFVRTNSNQGLERNPEALTAL
jgi:hypothetical protein